MMKSRFLPIAPAWFVFIVFLAANLASGMAAAQSESLPPQETERAPRTNPDAGSVAYTNGSWLQRDGDGERWVRETRYAIAGVFVDGPMVRVDRTVDLAGQYLIPPLAEGHNHTVEGEWTQEVAASLVQQGIFYFRNPSNVGDVARRNRPYWEQPGTLDVAFSHGALTGTGSHPVPLYRRLASLYGLDPEALDGVAFFELDTIAQLEARWPSILAGNPDFIKIILGDSTGENQQSLTIPVARRAVALAHASGLRVTAHIWTAGDLATAAAIGVDEVAHLPGYNWGDMPREAFVISPQIAQALAQGDIAVQTTSIIVADVGDAWRDPGAPFDRYAQLHRTNLRALLDAGVRLSIATDQGRSTFDEAEFLRFLDVMDDRALLGFWLDTGPSIFPGRAIGRLRTGFEASFIALECDPFVRFECLHAIGHLEKQGQEIERSNAS